MAHHSLTCRMSSNVYFLIVRVSLQVLHHQIVAASLTLPLIPTSLALRRFAFLRAHQRRSSLLW